MFIDNISFLVFVQLLLQCNLCLQAGEYSQLSPTATHQQQASAYSLLDKLCPTPVPPRAYLPPLTYLSQRGGF